MCTEEGGVTGISAGVYNLIMALALSTSTPA